MKNNAVNKFLVGFCFRLYPIMHKAIVGYLLLQAGSANEGKRIAGWENRIGGRWQCLVKKCKRCYCRLRLLVLLKNVNAFV